MQIRTALECQHTKKERGRRLYDDTHTQESVSVTQMPPMVVVVQKASVVVCAAVLYYRRAGGRGRGWSRIISGGAVRVAPARKRLNSSQNIQRERIIDARRCCRPSARKQAKPGQSHRERARIDIDSGVARKNLRLLTRLAMCVDG